MKLFFYVKSLLLWLFLLLSVCACHKPPVFFSQDITYARLGGELNLSDFNGRMRNLKEFKGKVIILFFGYTYCPDVCPTTLASMASLIHDMKDDAKNIQVIFISVDPQRDTALLLKQYVSAFHPNFLALQGTDQQIQIVARQFEVYYQRHGTGPYYTIDHSAGMFIFDRHGKLRLFAQYGMEEKLLRHDIKQLLNTL